MIRRIFLISCLVFLTSCDDGDILDITLEFDQELERCDNFENAYLVYDTREDPNEALILTLPKPEYDYLFSALPDNDPITLQIGSSTGIRFNYRTYGNVIDDDALCSELSDPNLVVIDDYETDGGEVIVAVTIVDDDNDGIPSIDEGLTGLPNADGIYEDSLDTDGDGIYDYLDEDDDNDNVLTEDEDDDSDGDSNPFTNPLDTDGDGTPDYLDDDDDNDGILTRLEDINENKNPRASENLVDDGNGGNIYRYLYNHPTAMESFADSGFIDNSYTRTTTTTFQLQNVGLDIIDATVIDLGSYIGPVETITQ